MATQTIWQAGQADADNINALAAVQQWWSRLQGQKILWQQRLLEGTTSADQLNWDRQRFDEDLQLDSSELRGVTLFWRKAGETQERNLTASKLELDPIHQQLNIYSQAQANLVVRVSIPQLKLQMVKLVDPAFQVQAQEGQHILIARDVTQGLEVQIVVSEAGLALLKQQLT